MPTQTRMPELAGPFAALGAWAGVLASDLLCYSIFGKYFLGDVRISAAAITGVFAAALGAWLTRRIKPDGWADPDTVRFAIAGAVVATGVLSGAAVGAVVYRSSEGAR